MKTRIQFYYNHVYPYLTYNILVWGGTYPTHLEPILVQQKRAIRTINNLPLMSHTNECFKTLGILKLIYTNFMFSYICIDSKTPLRLQEPII